MAKSGAQGTVFKVATATVGGVTSINGIEISADTIDVTALDSTSGYREKLPGFKEVGDVTISGYLDGSDAGQTQLYTLLNSGASASFSIIFPSAIGKTWSFTGHVVGYTTGAEVGDAITFEATITVTGQATLATTST